MISITIHYSVNKLPDIQSAIIKHDPSIISLWLTANKLTFSVFKIIKNFKYPKDQFPKIVLSYPSKLIVQFLDMHQIPTF